MILKREAAGGETAQMEHCILSQLSDHTCDESGLFQALGFGYK